MPAEEIHRIAVLGAGTMGSGLAQKYAMEGFPVLLLDVDQETLDRGMERIRETLGEAVERRILTAGQADAVLKRIRPRAGLSRGPARGRPRRGSGLRGSRGQARRVSSTRGTTRPDAILATNTSSFYRQTLAEITASPERVLGLHYFYHPAQEPPGRGRARPGDLSRGRRARLVAARADRQDPDRRGRCAWLHRQPLLRPVDQRGRAHARAKAWPESRRSSRRPRRASPSGIGPFQLMNLTGITIGHHAAATLARELGPFYAPAPIRSGRTWKRTGSSRSPALRNPTVLRAVRERLQGVGLPRRDRTREREGSERWRTSTSARASASAGDAARSR